METPTEVSVKLNKYSSRITEPKSQSTSQDVLYGVGLSEDAMAKPHVGVSSVWYEGNTCNCNMHLIRLSEAWIVVVLFFRMWSDGKPKNAAELFERASQNIKVKDYTGHLII